MLAQIARLVFSFQPNCLSTAFYTARSQTSPHPLTLQGFFRFGQGIACVLFIIPFRTYETAGDRTTAGQPDGQHDGRGQFI